MSYHKLADLGSIADWNSFSLVAIVIAFQIMALEALE